MQSLEAACEESEHICKKLKTERSALPLPCPQDCDVATPGCSTSASSSSSSSYNNPPFCIFEKLAELYEEERANDPNPLETGLKRDTLILDKLVVRERLNTLILNLYPGNKGYSLMFKDKSRSEDLDDTADMIEIKDMMYEDELLLSYIDNEELPPFLAEKLEPNHSFLFYSGCVIAEIRDYRQSYPADCDTHYVLLRPTLQSILSDLNGILDEKPDLTLEEKIQIESQILLANTPKLCLEPDSTLSEIETALNHNRQMWNTRSIRRMARKYFSVTVNHKRKLDQRTHVHGLDLYYHLQRQKRREKTVVYRRAREEVAPIPVPSLDAPLLAPPSGGVNTAIFKAYEKPKETSDCLPQLIEEYVLETDIPLKDGKKRLYHIKLSILQRPSNSEYLGELYLEWDHKEKEQNGVACRFSLGSKAHAKKYIQQFTDIFTENGRKRVKIRHRPGPKIASAQMQYAQLQSSLLSQVNLAQQHLAQLGQSNACVAPLVNGTLGLNVAHPPRTIQNASSSVHFLQAQLQAKALQQQLTTKDIEINAIVQQIEVAANAKQQQQQQQQRLVSSNVNMVNTMNILPHVALNQKVFARKMTLNNASVLNHSNLIAVNNNRMNLIDFNSQQQQQQQPGQQTITLNPNSANFRQTNNFTLKQPVNRTEKSTLSALLVGTPAADRPEIVNPNQNSPLFLDKLPSTSSTNFIPKPSPQHTQTSEQQNLNFITGLQNMQVQFPVLSQPISLSLNVSSSTGGGGGGGGVGGGGVSLQGQHPTSLIVTSLPVTTSTCTAVVAQQQHAGGSGGGVMNRRSPIALGTPTVVVGSSGSTSLAHLVASGVKGLNQQGLRAASPSAVTLTQGGQSYQLITPVQRPRLQQATLQQNVTGRAAVAASQLQKQVQLQQQLQQFYMNQQQKTMSTNNSQTKLRRRSSTAEPQ